VLKMLTSRVQLGTLYMSISGTWETQATNERNLEEFYKSMKHIMPELSINNGNEMALGAEDRTPRHEFQGVKESVQRFYFSCRKADD